MNSIWKTPIFICATVYFAVDGILSFVTRPVTAWIAERKVFERARLWIVSLRPYPALALFAVPVIILEPAKPLAAYLVASGHFSAGAATFVAAEVFKLAIVERLFRLNRKKLLSIPAFAWAYKYWLQMMAWVESTEVWIASRRLAVAADDMIRRRWLSFRVHKSRRLQFR